MAGERARTRRSGAGIKVFYLLSILTGIVLAPWALFSLYFSDPYDSTFRPPFGLGSTIRLNKSINLPPPNSAPPFRAVGRDILDSRNATVLLTSVNWYGASDIKFIPSGLDVRHRDEIAGLIRRMGFNSVRLPYSDEMVYKNPEIPAADLSANPDLIGRPALDIFIAVVNSLTDAGLYVIPNDHITQATWCCGANLCDALWKNDHFGPLCRVKQTEAGWIDNWRKVMRPLANNSMVIGADLRNEVRGPWGTLYWSSWAAAAERASEALLEINPAWLMFVEGISSANHLAAARKRPVKLSVPERVVYSAHVYAWSGWGQLAPYSRRTYNGFARSMRKNWGYLLEEGVAPVWVGEMGTPDWPSKGDLNYWRNLVRYLGDIQAGWAYWAINPRKPSANEWESYGLVNDDWETVRWDYRMNDLASLGLNAVKGSKNITKTP